MEKTRLMRELEKDPDAVFDVSADLPSGNRMRGTVGPLIGDRCCCSIMFTGEASEEDIALATICMNKVMGKPAAMTHVARGQDALEEGATVARKFLGGGMG